MKFAVSQGTHLSLVFVISGTHVHTNTHALNTHTHTMCLTLEELRTPGSKRRSGASNECLNLAC